MPSPDWHTDPEGFLRDLALRAIAAAHPRACLRPALEHLPAGRRWTVLGAGKAAGAMAAIAWQVLGERASGLVIVPDGSPDESTGQIEVLHGAHPVPSVRGAAAATRLLERARASRDQGELLFLLSGGASSLLALPPQAVALDELVAISRALLRSGATIREINTVRKCLSLCAGGRVAAAACPAAIRTLVISDVAGDDIEIIGSGPTVASASTAADARRTLERYRIPMSREVQGHLDSPEADPLRHGAPELAGATATIVASGMTALCTAERIALDAGLRVLNLGDRVEGESRDVAAAHSQIVRSMRSHRSAIRPPCLLLSGGETTVTVGSGGGRGGRNGEYALALCAALPDVDATWAIACDTDGIDGTQDNAGAIFGPALRQRAAHKGLAAASFLQEHDSYGYFERAEGLFVTGPTGTNVNDFRAVLVL
jgi:hydroxypyruvate reductase